MQSVQIMNQPNTLQTSKNDSQMSPYARPHVIIFLKKNTMGVEQLSDHRCHSLEKPHQQLYRQYRPISCLRKPEDFYGPVPPSSVQQPVGQSPPSPAPVSACDSAPQNNNKKRECMANQSKFAFCEESEILLVGWCEGCRICRSDLQCHHVAELSVYCLPLFSSSS